MSLSSAWRTDLGSIYDDSTDRSMTLLAAVREGDHICIAADSLEIHSAAGYGSSVNKLERWGDRKLVWGWYGNSNAADALRQSMVTYGAPLSWEDLEYKYDSAVQMLDQQNAQTGGFAILVAGFLDDKWKIKALGRHHLDSENPDEWCFLGQNRLAARVGWDVASDTLELEDRFYLVMDAVIRDSPNVLGGPVTGWRITPTACEPIWTV
jgi:hypothetical protein